MLATFVIGLREGLEAALIVGIIAAFLRNNGKSLTAMWLGVGLALILSLAVGVGLDLVEQALPQAAQEGMETVIGAVAIFFVTGMIAWMNKHARSMKRELEAQAAEALSQTSTFALAAMAFLAVLKEGFETAVFLLATFSAAQSAVLAATGAVLGVLLSVVIGWGIYIGGVKINLSRFFRVTGAFLILVAAGLVITALRTAHEAGWLNAGQQPTVNLSWLVAPGTVQSALITGVLGIPTDPRLIEVIGWCAYLLPVAIFVYWPQARRPSPRAAIRLRFALALLLTILAGGLALGYPAPRLHLPDQAPIVAESDPAAAALGSAQLTMGQGGSPSVFTLSLSGHDPVARPLANDRAQRESHNGFDARLWQFNETSTPANAPATLTLDQVVALSGGRIPVGLNWQLHPGPYQAQWSGTRVITLWTAAGVLLDARQTTTMIVALSGSGLMSPRIVTVTDPANPAANWQLSPAYQQQVAVALNALASARTERQFWAVQLPFALVIGALILALFACVRSSRSRGPTGAASHFIRGVGKRADTPLREPSHAAD